MFKRMTALVLCLILVCGCAGAANYVGNNELIIVSMGEVMFGKDAQKGDALILHHLQNSPESESAKAFSLAPTNVHRFFIYTSDGKLHVDYLPADSKKAYFWKMEDDEQGLNLGNALGLVHTLVPTFYRGASEHVYLNVYVMWMGEKYYNTYSNVEGVQANFSDYNSWVENVWKFEKFKK